MLKHIFSVTHTPQVHGFILFIRASREFHSFLVHSYCLSRKHIQMHTVVAMEMVSSLKKCVYVYVYAKLSYTTSRVFMRIFSHTEDAFHLMLCPQKKQHWDPVVLRSVPCSLSLQQFWYPNPTVNNPEISQKPILDAFSQCYHFLT